MLIHACFAHFASLGMSDLLAASVASWQIIRTGNKRVNHAEVHAHVPHRLATDWACVVVAGVLRKTVAVHEVATGQLLQQSPQVSATQSS